MLIMSALFFVSPYSHLQEEEAKDAPNEKVFQGDPEGKALYDLMVKALSDAESISWVSDYRWEARGKELSHSNYRIWMKKPNYARVEAHRFDQPDKGGVLVGDGDYFYTYWKGDKPRYQYENSGKYAEEYDKYKNSYYIKNRSPVGRHSIGHDVGKLGAGICMSIIDPSTFHGYTDSLQSYLDGVKSMGEEKLKDEIFDVVEVSFMKHQRSWYLWLSRKDHLPRKLKEIVRVSYEIITHETWTDVTINGDISLDKFKWSVPEGWKHWVMPPIEEGLLKPGIEAPDFELKSVEGAMIKLSSFRGKTVLLNKWRCG